MRDTHKDKVYFDEYLKYQHSRIEKKINKLEEANEEKKQRVLMSLTSYEVDLLKAEFSIGASKYRIKSLLDDVIKIVKDYNNITYDDLLTLLSLSVMVGYDGEVNILIKNNTNIIEEDRLLKYIGSYIQSKKAIWNENVPLCNEFSTLDNVFDASDRELALSEYLDEWYENHLGYAWYNAHQRGSNTYCGYWSFESAAIAIIMGLDESKLKDSAYYPSF